MKNKVVFVLALASLVALWCYYPNRDVQTIAFKMKLPLPGLRALCIGRLVADLNDSRLGVPAAAAFALGDSGDSRAVAPLIAALRNADSPLSVAAAVALARVGPPAVEPLIGLLQDPNPGVRRQAILALREGKDRRAVEPLIEELKDKDTGVRREAVEALGDVKDSRGVAPLIGMLKDPELDIRVRGVVALGEIRAAQAVEPLIAILKDPNPELRKQAAVALGKIKDLRAVEPLLAVVKDPDWPVREASARSLGEIKDARATASLYGMLTDGEWSVRARAATALSAIGWQPKTTEERIRWLVAARGWLELAPLGAPGVDALLAALKDKNSDIRTGAARGLGFAMDRRAVDPLIALLNDPGVMVRREAIRSLGKIGDKRAAAAMVPSLTDWDVRDLVVIELFRLGWRPRGQKAWVHVMISQSNFVMLKAKGGWPNTRKALMEDLNSGDPQTVRYAVNSFIALGQEDAVPVLVQTLNAQGTKHIAEIFATCGHPQLRKAAEQWALAQQCPIHPETLADTLPWGSW